MQQDGQGMGQDSTPGVPYLLLFVAPVLLGIVIVAALNLRAFVQLLHVHAEALAEQSRDIEQIAFGTQLNQDLAAIQDLTSEALDDAASGELEEALVYLLHTEIVERLARLQPVLRHLVELEQRLGQEATVEQEPTDHPGHRSGGD